MPLRSLREDPAPIRVRRTIHKIVGDSRVELRPQVLFERETVPTSEDLHAIGRLAYTRVIAVGDHGTVLVRDPERGWQAETPGTNADLYAFDSVYSERSATAVILVVGSGGSAVKRSVDGRWSRELTGTSSNLYGIVSSLKSTETPGKPAIVRRSPDGVWPVVDYSVVVGASGTMLERSEDGRWTQIDSGTTDDLRVARMCGADRVCAVTDRGAAIQCTRASGRFTCAARAGPPFADADYEFPVRSEYTSRADLERITVARDGTIRLYADRSAYRPEVASVVLPYAGLVNAVELDVADGFLVGQGGLLVHLAPQPIHLESICLE